MSRDPESEGVYQQMVLATLQNLQSTTTGQPLDAEALNLLIVEFLREQSPDPRDMSRELLLLFFASVRILQRLTKLMESQVPWFDREEWVRDNLLRLAGDS